MTADVRLWVLFMAVQLMDVFWTSFLLLGVEKARVESTWPSVPLDLYYMPYSHSLVAVLMVCVAVFLLYRRFVPPRNLFQPALFVALAVLSHWLLDLPVHRQDLPLYDNIHKMGLGWWNYPFWAFLLEIDLLFTGIIMYLRASKATGAIGKYGMLLFGLALTIIQAGIVYGPRPPWLTIEVTAVSLLVYYIASAAVVARLEKHRYQVK